MTSYHKCRKRFYVFCVSIYLYEGDLKDMLDSTMCKIIMFESEITKAFKCIKSI